MNYALMSVQQCTFAGNVAGDYGGGICNYLSGTGEVLGCVLWGNTQARYTPNLHDISSTPLAVTYSCIGQAGYAGADGNIDATPLFFDPGHWDDKGTPETDDDEWVDGDYHLQSTEGRWNPAAKAWESDSFDSPCIDAGDPASDCANEPAPNGSRVNMGAYGNTAEASKSAP